MRIEELVREAKEGNDEAFFKLIAINKERLYKVLYRYFNNELDTYEGIQEVTCRAYIRLKTLKEDKYFNTWLMKIAMNYAVDENRKKKKVLLVDREKIVQDGVREGGNRKAIINESDATLDKIIIEEALQKIKPEYKRIIELKYFEDMTSADMARELNIPEGTIRSQLKRGLKELREIIKERSAEHV